MDRKSFLEETIASFSPEILDAVKDDLFDSYIKLEFVCNRSAYKEQVLEKLNDYFEKVELNTGKSFDKIIKGYA